MPMAVEECSRTPLSAMAISPSSLSTSTASYSVLITERVLKLRRLKERKTMLTLSTMFCQKQAAMDVMPKDSLLVVLAELAGSYAVLLIFLSRPMILQRSKCSSLKLL